MVDTLKRNSNNVGLIAKDSEAYVNRKSKKQFQKDVISRLNNIEQEQKNQEKLLMTIINLVYNIDQNLKKDN